MTVSSQFALKLFGCIVMGSRVVFSKPLLVATEDPNLLRLRKERLNKGCLETYKAKRRDFHIYKAASKLWAAGISWEKALTTITEAFDATTHEAQ